MAAALEQGFNPRTPCGVRLNAGKLHLSYYPFQSTHSLRSATVNGLCITYSPEVSIHALLAECDGNTLCMSREDLRFNPRTPCGVRLDSTHVVLIPEVFQSTHSLRSATAWRQPGEPWPEVSIHALLAECDMWSVPLFFLPECFNPRTPCGVRQ